MSEEAERAFEAAKRIIAESKTRGSERLDFNTPITRTLNRLPEEIKDLFALKFLILDHTQITDLFPLSTLIGLNTLSLDHTQITDLSPLSTLIGLNTLSLENTRITDLSPLATLTSLSTLDLVRASINDISPLSALTGLRELNLNGTHFTDLSPLTVLSGLRGLYLNFTQITDLSLLSNLTGLRALSLDGTEIADLSLLNQLTELSTLSLYFTRITDLWPLTKLTALSTLYLNHNEITDLSPMTKLTGLRTLHLHHNLIADLTPLTKLTGLTTLTLHNTNVLDLRPLRGLSGLVESPDPLGLTFESTAATGTDSRIAEIAEITDPATRARQLFAYLEHWEPPVPPDLPDAPSYIVPDTGPITSGDDPPQGGDEDQEDLRQDLIRKASVLIEAIGTSNQLAILSGAASHYQKQVAKDLPCIRLNLLYSAANSLRVAYEAHVQALAQDRINDQLPPRAAAALLDLVETHALFFMGFPNAAEVHQKMLAGLTGGRNRAVVAAAEPIVQALEGKTTVLDPEDHQAMADDLAGAKGEGPSAEIAERRLTGRITNMVFAVARKAYAAAKTGGKKVMEHDIIAAMLGNQTAIGAFLKVTQGTVAGWVEALMAFLMKL